MLDSSHKSSDSGLDTCTKKYHKTTLDLHNYYRAKHHVGSLRTSSDLMRSAKRYADHLARIDQFKHSRRGSEYRRKGVGENLALDYGVKNCAYMAKSAMGRYYKEVSLFDFNRGGFSLKTGHFTQIVWKSTTKLGCAISFKSATGKYYGVCHYSPAGNYRGRFRQNVFRI